MKKNRRFFPHFINWDKNCDEEEFFESFKSAKFRVLVLVKGNLNVKE